MFIIVWIAMLTMLLIDSILPAAATIVFIIQFCLLHINKGIFKSTICIG